MIEIEPLIVSELDSMLPLPDGRRADWTDVLRRSGISEQRQQRRRPHLTRRRLVAAIVIVVLALTLPALALSGVLGSLFGVSNHGKPAHATAFNREELNGRLIFKEFGLQLGPANAADPDTLARLAFREGIGVYSARSKEGNRRCYYTGQYYSTPDQGHPDKLHLAGGCGPYVWSFALPERLTNLNGRQGERQQHTWLQAHTFPSAAWPILVVSESPFVGVAANGVRAIQLLALSDCHPLVTVPVIDNVYIDAHPPTVAAAFIVARDASGQIVWHSAKSDLTSQYERVPIDRKMPHNCGLR